jgi:DNA-3-methyladenine glycosylase II
VLADGAPVDGAIAFPTPAALARRDPGELRTLGFSARKAEYVVGLARAVEDGSLELSALPGLDDDAVVAVLVALRGIGRWTAEWFLLRTLGRPDALPAGDLGVRKAVASADGLAILPEPAVRERAERWRPIRGLAALQLLHVLY